jgi:dethiobiotin synthetase
MKNIFISATNTNIGKTYTTLKLLEEFSSQGYRVGAFKPIESGVVSNPPDANLLLEKCKVLNSDFKDVTIGDICPIQLELPAAPFVSKGDDAIDFDLILKKYKTIKNRCDILLIEGAGGLLVPVDKDIFMIDFIKMFSAHTLLVTVDKLGCINDALLSLEALKTRDMASTWCINLHDDNSDFETITMPFYKSYFKEVYTIQKDLTRIANNLYSHVQE